MNHLKDLLIDLSDSIRVYKTDENKKENIKSVVNNISKIEFYIKNTLSYE